MSDEKQVSTASDFHEDTPGSSGMATEHDDDIRPIAIAAAALKRWKALVGIPFGMSFVAALISLVLPQYFRATSTFVPETSQSGLPSSGLLAVASQFGVGIPGGEGSPQFYEAVLRSRTISDSILLARFPTPGAESRADSTAFVTILGIDGDTEAERLELGREELRDITSTEVDAETNVVSVSVETRSRNLSAAVANHYIFLLNRFNLETRQSQAQVQRTFVESRLRSAENELSTAEENLERFLTENRAFGPYSQLQSQHDRLQRQVAIKQEIVMTLTREFEESRIEEVNDTPVITVIDEAVPPQEKHRPRRKIIVVLSFMIACWIAAAHVFIKEYQDNARESGNPDFAEFSKRWEEVKQEARRILVRKKA